MRESDENLDHDTESGHLQPVPQFAALSAEYGLHHAASTSLSATQLQSCSQGGTDPSFKRDDCGTDAPQPADGLRDRVIRWLQTHVPASRLEHILRVEQMAVELANLHRVDSTQAAQAGLMHDLAKFFKPQRLLQMAQAEGVPLDPVDVANPHLLHAAVGAIVARDDFGIHNEAVLDAIRNHTLGCPGMSDLSCVVFLADSLEPGRGDTSELVALRQSSQQSLYRAVWLTCDESLRHLLARSQQIHPRMVLTRNWALALAYRKPQPSRAH
jgi:predicted HD superfamily hydrolase involved in NAD metabolism